MMLFLFGSSMYYLIPTDISKILFCQIILYCEYLYSSKILLVCLYAFEEFTFLFASCYICLSNSFKISLYNGICLAAQNTFLSTPY